MYKRDETSSPFTYSSALINDIQMSYTSILSEQEINNLVYLLEIESKCN